MRTVREATFDVLCRRGLLTLFANPGSTEVDFLVDLPDDMRFVLALHESAVIGMATGYAIGGDEPALAVLHTTAGLGNAVGALATARVNRAPLVVLVGQQDRRHLASEPFLAGRLAGLAGDYPVGVEQPGRAQDVPGAVERAYHLALDERGPALVIVPMDDWSEPAEEGSGPPVAVQIMRATSADAAAPDALAELLAGATAPALVAGAGADDAPTRLALVQLAERLACPVFQEAFSARAGFPQDHPRFAGHLPADRARLREMLSGHDVVLVVGGPAFRQYPYAAGPFVEAGTRVAVITQDAAEARRSSAELAVVAPLGPVCAELAGRLPARDDAEPSGYRRPAPLAPPAKGASLRASHVFDALAERLPADAVVVEETPSSRPDLERRLPARSSLGFLSAAMGGLGFAIAAATGVRMALPRRRVVAVVGDGSALYGIQALWSAAHYDVGALFVVLSNGGYAIMDRLAEHRGGTPPWPGFSVDVAGIATSLGCRAQRVQTHDELVAALDSALGGASDGREPLLLDVVVAQEATFAP